MEKEKQEPNIEEDKYDIDNLDAEDTPKDLSIKADVESVHTHIQMHHSQEVKRSLFDYEYLTPQQSMITSNVVSSSDPSEVATSAILPSEVSNVKRTFLKKEVDDSKGNSQETDEDL